MLRKKLKHIIFFFSLCLLLFFSCKKEIDADKEKENVFVKYFGGNTQDEGIKLLSTPDEGFYICGNTTKINNSDIILIKTDKTGNKIWEKKYGSSLNEMLADLKYATDGNIFIVGNQINSSGKSNIYVLKINNNGDILWERNYGKQQFNEFAFSATALKDNSLVFTGTTDERNNNDLYYVKVNTNGDSLWSRIYGYPTINEFGINIIENADSLIIFFDSENKTTLDKNISIIKTTNIGTIFEYIPPITIDQGQKLQHIFWHSEQQAYIAISNRIISGQNNYQITFQKISPRFTLNQAVPFAATKSDFANQIIKTSDNGYAIIGTTTSYGEGKDDIYLLRLDASGNKIFYKTFGGIGDDKGYAIIQTKDEGFVITGSTEFEGNTMICLLKTNKKGELLPN